MVGQANKFFPKAVGNQYLEILFCLTQRKRMFNGLFNSFDGLLVFKFMLFMFL